VLENKQQINTRTENSLKTSRETKNKTNQIMATQLCKMYAPLAQADCVSKQQVVHAGLGNSDRLKASCTHAKYYREPMQ
jgi:hypothetical protein